MLREMGGRDRSWVVATCPGARTPVTPRDLATPGRAGRCAHPLSPARRHGEEALGLLRAHRATDGTAVLEEQLDQSVREDGTVVPRRPDAVRLDALQIGDGGGERHLFDVLDLEGVRVLRDVKHDGDLGGHGSQLLCWVWIGVGAPCVSVLSRLQTGRWTWRAAHRRLRTSGCCCHALRFDTRALEGQLWVFRRIGWLSDVSHTARARSGAGCVSARQVVVRRRGVCDGDLRRRGRHGGVVEASAGATDGVAGVPVVVDTPDWRVESLTPRLPHRSTKPPLCWR